MTERVASMAGVGGAERCFSSGAAEAIRSAQAAVLGLISEAGLEGARASELARSLKLDKTLAWKLVKFGVNPDPRAAFRHLPGANGIEIVVRAAGEAGVDASRLEEVQRADEDLRSFVRRHAGDRRTFEAMLAGERPDAKAEFEERRAFFRAGSAIWGVRARAQFLTLALRPSPVQENKIDCLQVSGFIGLERLRPDLPWVIRRLRVHDDAGSGGEPFEREALDSAGVVSSSGGERPLSLLSEFSTHPLPAIRQRLGANGWLYDELSTGDVGRNGAVDVVAGEIYHAAVPLLRSDENTEGRYILTVRTPLEGVQFDLLLHPSLEHFRWPMVSVLGNLEERASSERAPGREIQPVRPADAVTSGGFGSASIPSYSRLLTRAFELGGWGDPSSFRVFRAAMEYPPAPCEVVMTSELE